MNLLPEGGSHPWIRIFNGLNKFVRDLTEKIRNHEDKEDTLARTVRPVTPDSRIGVNSRISADKSAAKARPKQTAPHSSSFSPTRIPIHSRKWIDVEPREQRNQSYPVAKIMNTLLRHKPLPREKDGAIEFWRFKMEFVSGFSNSVYWSRRTWIDHLRGGGGQKKRFQYSTDSIEQEILDLRAIQGHSRENLVDPSLQDTVLIRDYFSEYIYHVGCYFNMHSIIESGLIAGGKNASQDRQAVFFTAVHPLAMHCISRKNSI